MRSMSYARTLAMLVMCGANDPSTGSIISRPLANIGNHGPGLSMWPLLAKCFDMQGWTLRHTGPPIQLRHEDGTSLTLDRDHLNVMLRELLDWYRFYLPGFSLKGKTVLDAGAGCGESAAFYFFYGAKRVIAIEKDPAMRPYLEQNAADNGWDMEIIIDEFRPEHLDIHRDWTKIDIEGGESVLESCPKDSLGPCTIEMHPTVIGKAACDQIIKRFGLKHLDRKLWGL